MKSQDEIAAELTAEIINLEKTVERPQSELIITKNVHNILTNEVDDQQQYQRRQRIVIDGLQNYTKRNNIASYSKSWNVLAQHLKLDPDGILNQTDKCHCIGPLKDDDTQSTIVRFKSHSFREKAHVNRKKCSNGNIKVKLSLTKKRRKTLTYGY